MAPTDILIQLRSARDLIDSCINKISKSRQNAKKSRGTRTSSENAGIGVGKIDFDLNERNFIKTYAKNLSGPKKFTLLLARIAKGKTAENVDLKIIRTRWNKMKSKSLMGYKFNLFYTNEAKNHGWVDSGKTGTYHLTNSWQGIFN